MQIIYSNAKLYIVMQQKINPQVQTQLTKSNAKLSNLRIIQLKGKPFWLSLSQDRPKHYTKYKQNFLKQLNELQTNNKTNDKLNDKTNDKTNDKLNNKNEKESQYQESISNDNQTYSDDFQSYEQQLKANTKRISYKQNQAKVITMKSNIKLSTNKDLINSRIRSKINTNNASGNYHMKQGSTKLKKFKNLYVKTQTSKNDLAQTLSLNYTFSILMYEREVDLRKQNEKMMRKVQQLRKLIPILIVNNKQLKQQQFQLEQLQKCTQRASNPSYQFSLYQNRSLIYNRQQMIYKTLKTLNSPKQLPKQKSYLNDDYHNQISSQTKLRQRLMHQMRLVQLRQKRYNQLDNKIKVYQTYIHNINIKQNHNKCQQLQKRTIFLNWDIQRLKNQYDITFIQKQIQNDLLKNQLHQIQSKLQLTANMLSQVRQNKQKQQQVSKILQSPVRKKLFFSKLPNSRIINQKIQKKQIFEINTKQKTEQQIQQESKYVQKQILKHKLKQNYQIRQKAKQEVKYNPDQYLQSQLIKPFKSSLIKEQKNLSQVLLKQRNKQKYTSPKLNIRIKRSLFTNSNQNDDVQQLFL